VNRLHALANTLHLSMNVTRSDVSRSAAEVSVTESLGGVSLSVTTGLFGSAVSIYVATTQWTMPFL
jgi:hypothetical protein